MVSPRAAAFKKPKLAREPSQSPPPYDVATNNSPNSQSPAPKIDRIPSAADVRIDIQTPHGNKLHFEAKSRGRDVSVNMKSGEIKLSTSPHTPPQGLMQYQALGVPTAERKLRTSASIHSALQSAKKRSSRSRRFRTNAPLSQAQIDRDQDDQAPIGRQPEHAILAAAAATSPIARKLQENKPDHVIKISTPTVTPPAQPKPQASFRAANDAVSEDPKKRKRRKRKKPKADSLPDHLTEPLLPQQSRSTAEEKIPEEQKKSDSTKKSFAETFCEGFKELLKYIAATITASPTAFNAFMSGIYFMCLKLAIKTAQTLGSIIDNQEILPGERPANQHAALALALTLCIFSLYVNIKQVFDFFLSFGEKSGVLLSFLKNIATCSARWTAKTGIDIVSLLTTLGSVIAYAFMNSDPFSSIDKYPIERLLLDIIAVNASVTMFFVGRFVFSRNFIEDFLPKIYTMDEAFLLKIIKILEETIKKLQKDIIDGKTPEQLAKAAAAAAQNKDTSLFQDFFKKILAYFKIEDLKHAATILKASYPEFRKLLSEELNSKESFLKLLTSNPKVLIAVVLCTLAGHLTYAEKFASLIPTMGEGIAQGLWDAFRLLIGAFFTLSSAAAYGISTYRVPIRMREYGKDHPYWAAWYAFASMMSAGSMEAVGIREAENTQTPPILLPKGMDWKTDVYLTLLGFATAAMNFVSCINVEQAKENRKRAEEAAAKLKEVAPQAKKLYEELKADNQRLQNLKKQIQAQRKTKDETGFFNTLRSLRSNLYRSIFNAPIPETTPDAEPVQQKRCWTRLYDRFFPSSSADAAPLPTQTRPQAANQESMAAPRPYRGAGLNST